MRVKSGKIGDARKSVARKFSTNDKKGVFGSRGTALKRREGGGNKKQQTPCAIRKKTI